MSARLVIPSIDSSAAFLSSDGLLTSMLSYSREIVFLRNRSDAAGPDSRYGSRYSFQMFANSVILGYAYTMIAAVAIHTDTVKTIIFAPLSVAK